MCQLTEYIWGHTIEKRMYALTGPNFLTGQAYSFWESSVLSAPWKWELRDLFRELLNYCFPADYCLQMVEKLRKSYQNNRTVREYVHELENLFLTVGIMSERQKVDKLWNGFNVTIQRELWKQQLTPMRSSWAEVCSWAVWTGITEKLSQCAGHHMSGYHNENCRDESGSGRVRPQKPDNGRSGHESRTNSLSQTPPGNRNFERQHSSRRLD